MDTPRRECWDVAPPPNIVSGTWAGLTICAASCSQLRRMQRPALPRRDKGGEDSRKIGLIAAIPMKASGSRMHTSGDGPSVGAGAQQFARERTEAGDECFSGSATRGRQLTQDRANHGNRGKAIRGGLATFSLGELSSAGGSVLRALQHLHCNLRSASRRRRDAGRCRHGGLLVEIGRGDHA